MHPRHQQDRGVNYLKLGEIAFSVLICQNDGQPSNFSIIVKKINSVMENIQFMLPLSSALLWVHETVHEWIFWGHYRHTDTKHEERKMGGCGMQRRRRESNWGCCDYNHLAPGQAQKLIWSPHKGCISLPSCLLPLLVTSLSLAFLRLVLVVSIWYFVSISAGAFSHWEFEPCLSKLGVGRRVDVLVCPFISP